MGTETDYQSIINDCNAECQKCIEDFQKDGIPFSSRMCKFCSNGAKLHKALRMVSKTEQEWDKIDWGSSAWKDVYKG